MTALRVLFDTNAYDAILTAGDQNRIAALIVAGKISIVVTPVQEDEIRQIKDHAEQAKLLALLRRLGGTRIDPAAVIAADITYMSRDEILSRVAETSCDMLVTEDRALREGCRVGLSYAEFATRIQE